MKIEQSGKKTYQPVTITLETEQEAEILMCIMSHIGGDMYNSPRIISDVIYGELLKYGIDYRDENFMSKFPSRGTIIFQDYE